MRRKRLQHHADIFCQMFRGWQLHSDHRRLTDLGSGTLEIDVLKEKCRHNGKSVKGLVIADAIAEWWRRDMTTHRIARDDIEEASLVVELKLGKQLGQRKRSVTWANSSLVFVSCRIRAHSLIRTNEATYESRHVERLEWPRNWAA